MLTDEQLKREAILQGLLGNVVTVHFPAQEVDSAKPQVGVFSEPLPQAPLPVVNINGYTLEQVAETMERLIEENNGLRDELRETKAALKRTQDINRELTNRENLE